MNRPLLVLLLFVSPFVWFEEAGAMAQRPAPPTDTSRPSNCRPPEEVRRGLPEGEGLNCRRHVCEGYFWGEGLHALDFCRTTGVERFGEGEAELAFNVSYVRFPSHANSREEWQTILVPTPETRMRLPQCGTYGSLEVEGGTESSLLEKLEDFFVGAALAQSGEANSMTPWTEAERNSAARVLLRFYHNLNDAVQRGEYGPPGSEQRVIVERLLGYTAWSIREMDPSLSGRPAVPVGLAMHHAPPIFWDPAIPAEIGGYYEYGDEGVIIRINELYNRAYFWDDHVVKGLLHELSHSANDSLGFGLGSHGAHLSIDPQARRLFDEGLSDILGNILYLRHFTDPSHNPFFVEITDNDYANFMRDPYYSFVDTAIERADVFFQGIPDDQAGNYMNSWISSVLTEGGISWLELRDPFDEGSLTGPSSLPNALQDVNWRHGPTGQPNYIPTGVPGRDPGTAGNPPPPGSGPPGIRERGGRGGPPNDPNWSPPSLPPSTIPVPASVRNWTPGPPSNPCGTGPAPYNWCWDRDPGPNAGRCRTITQHELDLPFTTGIGLPEGCPCSTAAGCREAAEPLLPAYRAEHEGRQAESRRAREAAAERERLLEGDAEREAAAREACERDYGHRCSEEELLEFQTRPGGGGSGGGGGPPRDDPGAGVGGGGGADGGDSGTDCAGLCVQRRYGGGDRGSSGWVTCGDPVYYFEEGGECTYRVTYCRDRCDSGNCRQEMIPCE